MATLTVEGVDFEVTDDEVSTFIDLLSLLSPVLPVLSRVAKEEGTRIIQGIISDDPYDALEQIRENCTDEEWESQVKKFVEDGEEFNRQAVELRGQVTKSMVSVLVGVLCAVI